MNRFGWLLSRKWIDIEEVLAHCRKPWYAVPGGQFKIGLEHAFLEHILGESHHNFCVLRICYPTTELNFRKKVAYALPVDALQSTNYILNFNAMWNPISGLLNYTLGILACYFFFNLLSLTIMRIYFRNNLKDFERNTEWIIPIQSMIQYRKDGTAYQSLCWTNLPCVVLRVAWTF